MANDSFTETICNALELVPGIAAIVLGGSRARGTATASSDYDIGLYYETNSPIDIEALRNAIAALVDNPSEIAATSIGEWGPWINGGAWLTVGGRKVDLLYRDLRHVRSVIADCNAGRVTIDYQPGHPHGFCSAIYAGEVALCRPLLDKAGSIEALKTPVLPYPVALAAALIAKFHREVQFSIDNAVLAVRRQEQTHVAGCTYRALCCIAQVLFAINHRYLINEKGALPEAATLPLTIPDLTGTLATIWNAIGDGHLADATARLSDSSRELDELVAASGR